MEKLVKHLDFDSFKNNSAVNAQELKEIGYFKKEGAFVRKGTKMTLHLKFNQCGTVAHFSKCIMSNWRLEESFQL